MSALPVTGSPAAVPAAAVPAAAVPAAVAAWAGLRADGGPVILASASWPLSPADQLPAIPGFVTSSFSPLVAELADRCLGSYFGAEARPGAGRPDRHLAGQHQR